MITLRQLRYLDAVARHRHFGRAAAECAVSQPALSQQIHELEQRLGLVLVERGSRLVGLTPDGDEVVARASAILAGVRDLADFARHRGAPLSGTLRLGVIPSIAPYLLPAALRRLHAAYPDLDLRLRETRTEPLLADLVTGKLDAVVVALPVAAPGIETLALFDDPFLLAVGRDEAAPAGGGAASLEMIEEDRLLLLEEGHCLRDQALGYCRIDRSKVSRTLGASSLSTIVQMVANGYGVTLLPELCVGADGLDERIALLRFREPAPRRTVALAWRRSSPRQADYMALAHVLRAARADGDQVSHADRLNVI